MQHELTPSTRSMGNPRESRSPKTQTLPFTNLYCQTHAFLLQHVESPYKDKKPDRREFRESTLKFQTSECRARPIRAKNDIAMLSDIFATTIYLS